MITVIKSAVYGYIISSKDISMNFDDVWVGRFGMVHLSFHDCFVGTLNVNAAEQAVPQIEALGIEIGEQR